MMKLVVFLMIVSCTKTVPDLQPARPFTLSAPPNSQIQKAFDQATGPTKQKLARLLYTPTAVWLGEWSGDVGQVVQKIFLREKSRVPIVIYNIPDRDCGGHSKGGATSTSSYMAWIDKIAQHIGPGSPIFILEPDTVAFHAKGKCADTKKLEAIAYSVKKLKWDVDGKIRRGKPLVYIDAGHPTFIKEESLEKLAKSLRLAGIDKADGFALNVSNFHGTQEVITYGAKLSKLVGGKPFVIDTSRNGNGSNGEWCNPKGRKLGNDPALNPINGVDAYLWIKVPGESDGKCQGGPAAGKFWLEYALGLMP